MLDQELLQSTIEDIKYYRKVMLEAREDMDAGHPRYQSMLNLKQYLILRDKDLTQLQEKLFKLSLSSLGRSYAHVAASIDTIYDQLSSSLQLEQISEDEMRQAHHLSIEDAIAIASHNAKELFGGQASSKLSRQSTSIMITLPSNAADNDGELIKSLANAGVNVFRINTAHDNVKTYRAMADVIYAINANRCDDNKIKIFVDLAGPKIRTCAIRRLELPVAIGSNKFKKEIIIAYGDMQTKSQSTNSLTLQKDPAQISVDKAFFKSLSQGDIIKVVDINEKKASIEIVQLHKNYAYAIIDKKVYLDKSVKLKHKKHHSHVQNVVCEADAIRLAVDDYLIIGGSDLIGSGALFDSDNKIVKPAQIGCSHEGVFKNVKIGDRVFIDDGKISLSVVEKKDDSILCKVTNAKANGTLLKEEKGINFPDSYIKTSAITQSDIGNLEAVLDFADHFSISFCQSADDVRVLKDILQEHGRSDIGIVAKIETKQAVANMPSILDELLCVQKSGVMIARGDLAIEVGFENMAHVQEALLDICDAAHMPVIWATQVLESKMKSNLPSRAEVTDAAMSGRAECVMLNKGAFAIDTIEVLIHILDDMHKIFRKNRQLLKREELWYQNND